MSNELRSPVSDLSRRAFLARTGGTFAGVAAAGLAGPAHAAPRHSKRGGTLRFAMQADSLGLDPHRNVIYLVSHPLAATTQGLLDLGLQSQPVPGIATEWSVSKDVKTYTFKLRKGVLFHNGREVDAAAVKWNYERIKNPKTSHVFTRSALGNLKEVVALDKYTLRCHLHEPSAAFLANVVYYPCNLIAPDSVEQVDTHPIGCGPFKFVKWERHNITVMERFENYFETDAEGNALPYLDRIVGRPKKVDRVRVTALRGGEVDMIDNMAYADAAEFPTKYAGKFQTWDVPTWGTAFITFNLAEGPFADKNGGKILRQAAAHAVDHEAIHRAVYYGRGSIAAGYYAKVSPWYTPDAKSWPEYDPEKAKFLLKKAKAIGTPVVLQSNNAYALMQQTGELLQAMWTEVGFKVKYDIYDAATLREKRRASDFHAESMGGSYRFDPDGWFSRQILSTGATTKRQSRFQNARADKLILEARRTIDTQKRLEIYAEVESIVNDELPVLYTQHAAMLQAGVLNIKGYQPGVSGHPSSSGAGIRTAWMA